MMNIISRCGLSKSAEIALAILLLLPIISLNSVAAGESVNRSRLLATGAVATVEGTAGGGIVPMAVLSGYGAAEEQGGTAFGTYLDTGDYQLAVLGASWSFNNRVEFSVVEQELTHNSLTKKLSLPTNSIRQRIYGAKVRLAGDLIYTALPQIALGVHYKQNRDYLVPSAVGSKSDSGTELNISASKLFLGSGWGRNVLVNGNLRYTNANQSGLVGFGGDKNSAKEWQPEVSGGLFLNKHWLVGAEYRSKPDNLSFIKEEDWSTAFVAWFPTKSVSLVAAYADLGEVATFNNQTGWYVSVQGSF